MEVKKNPKADLEKQKLIFGLIGLTLTLAIVFSIINWTTYDSSEVELATTDDVDIEEEIIPITRMKEPPPPPPPPPPPKPQPTEVLEIVEDDVEVEETVVIDAETDEEEEIVFEEPEVEIVEEEEEEIFVVVEDPPQFPGGQGALLKYVANNIKYPAIARENDIQGVVYVRFVVTKKGEVGEVQIGRGVHPSLDEEAIRVVKTLPKWTPGKQRGKPVSVWFTLPIRFKLS